MADFYSDRVFWIESRFGAEMKRWWGLDSVLKWSLNFYFKRDLLNNWQAIAFQLKTQGMESWSLNQTFYEKKYWSVITLIQSKFFCPLFITFTTSLYYTSTFYTDKTGVFNKRISHTPWIKAIYHNIIIFIYKNSCRMFNIVHRRDFYWFSTMDAVNTTRVSPNQSLKSSIIII